MLRRSVLALACAPLLASAARPFQLLSAGETPREVVVSPDASKRILQAANDLAQYLRRISGQPFLVAHGDGTTGFAVGLASQFPKVSGDATASSAELAYRENYLLRTHARGVLLLGAGEDGVEHAVWDFLYRLGYRQYFPGERWEIVPSRPDLAIELDVRASPNYRSRRIWYGFGAWDYAEQPYRTWSKRNRASGGVQLNTSHAYGRIIRELQKEFDAHPEYYPLIAGQRRPSKDAKLCIGNVELRRLVVRNELERVRRQPAIESVSLEPSDGEGWCECGLCDALGSISNRVVLLANEAAAAIAAEFPGKLVGLYAYNEHSPPPTIRVHPNVVVSVATAFLKGGFTLDEIIDGWARQGAVIGIREYYSVNTWDRDQPARARGGNLAYLARTIPAFHAAGARYLSAESSDNWGPNGLGYFLAARMLWDVSEAPNVSTLVEDFLTRAFGAAKESMRLFYGQLDGSRPHLLANDQIGRMFLALDQAYKDAASDVAVAERLFDLTLYAHYCALYRQYALASGSRRQEAFEAVIRHAYRMRTTMLVHTRALYRDLPGRDRTVTVPVGARWDVPESRNPWKSSRPFAREEVRDMVTEGVRGHPLTRKPIETVRFSTNLVPATPLGLAPGGVGEWGPGRGVQRFWLYSPAARTVELRITGGLIAHYRDRGSVRVSLASATTPQSVLWEDRSVPPNGREHLVQLKLPAGGLYRLTLSDGNDRTSITFPPDVPVAMSASDDEPMNDTFREWMAYFYVPKGTTVVGLFGGEHGEIQDSLGRIVYWLNGQERGFHAVPVPEKEDGKVWRVRYARGEVRLLTVPPVLAPTPAQLLLPAEVVSRDG